MILPALEMGGYSYQTQVRIGLRIGGGSHVVDLVAKKNSVTFLISVKWQQVSGTAEQKVPFEVICLEVALSTGKYDKAYVVLGGNGWKLRTFYAAGGLNQFLKMSGKVEILTLESFIARANMANL
jgi:hypothetical protein